jgi:2Fe-2S ferredoxin
MVTIKFKSETEEIIANAGIGETLLTVAQKAGVKLFGGCGGAGVCGTCHIFIDPEFVDKLDEPLIEEADMLEILPSKKYNSRLACQIIVSENMDGMTVIIP